ncbi:putative bifunctional diguanylate cyclase/phosphodiesterase [Rhizobium halophytocola]|uniref:Diguanylate cyclase (GGDEF)-like protein n=1 Tax=Rhizobium halophytocola TaxID=735519 RepID=A0ABS4DYW8_9HYPH|nr:EAL domain-containing protein [Rhizobium halophytocola]MBP1850883.1 diguanylate cyclase (GGDEF)-like protein [Rhizobium halophytocola]
MSFSDRIRTAYRNLVSFLSVPNDSPVLTVAQFEALSRQVPLLYIILAVNMLTVAWTHRQVAPDWMVVYIPAAFCGICALRGYSWYSHRDVAVTPEHAYARLRATNRLAPPITAVFVIWALALFQRGDAYQQAHVAFYLAVTVIGIMLCLMHLRSAVLLVSTIVTLPFLVTMALSGRESFLATAINIVFVSAALILVIHAHYNDFRQLALSRQALEERNAAVLSLSDENMRLANLDSLTKLSNRRRFFHNLERAFTRARGQNGRLAVAIVDLDGFKPINDLYGHAVGDKVLAEIGLRLARFEGDDLLIHRLDGDEFALLMTCAALDESHIITLSTQICDAIAAPIALANTMVQITGSLGAAIYPNVGSSGQDLYERADYALHTAKRQQRAGIVLFNQQQADELSRQQVVEEALATADLAQELSLAFQPIIDVQTGRVAGFEALARWTSPQLGRVSPGEFIPVAEQSGRITLITRMLLDKALAVAATWPKDVYLSFNLSSHDLASSDGMLRLLASVEAGAVDPSRINFEITETAVMYDFEQTRSSIQMLRHLGAGVSLDDFGTGYSSLSHIHRLPLTRIKIDRSFVSNIQSLQSSMKIVRSVLTLCFEMDLDTVVEGVETDQELFTVEALGARFVQGFHFSAPISAEETLPAIARLWCQPAANRRIA